MKAMPFGPLNLKWKFILVVVLVAAATSIFGNAIKWQLDLRLFVESVENRISVLAQALGDNATAAIRFRSREDATSILQSLKQEPTVRAAYLFDAQGQTLAQYLVEGEPLAIPLIKVGLSKVEMTKDRMEILRPIRLDQKIIGAIFISSDLGGLRERKILLLQVAAVLLICVVVIAVVLGLWAQRYLIQPIASLAELAENIGRDKNFSLRATNSSHDEIGILAKNFNFMLGEIETGAADLRKKSEQLKSSNEQLEQFANIAAHDLQEPLRKVRSYADRLLTKCHSELSEQGGEYLHRLDKSVERMQTLVNDLLEFSRIKSRAKPFAQTDLNKIVATIESDLQIRITELGGKVEVGRLPIIDADSTQIQQLLQNLIANGLKFHRRDHSPCVSVFSHLLSGTRSSYVDRISSVDRWEIVVKDNGIGFDEKYLGRIFEPFQRLHGREDYEGTGMGLAICRRIVERHRGTITAKSAPDKGATFIVTLPAKQVIIQE